jgi:hypothetical protein
MPEQEREPRWHAGAVGRIPDDDSLVYRDDAVYGPQFYAKSPSAAEEASRLLNDLEDQLALAVAVAEAARWACVATLDSQTPEAEMATIRKSTAEILLDALKAYDDDRTKRGLVSVSKM